MKGMLDFLERAGLVKKDAPAVPTDATVGPGRAATDGAPLGSGPPPAPVPAVPAAGVATALNLNDIYAEQGVGPALYPAERLLRLVDGLSAMDEATRQMAIKAMDAADESWTIQDPLADAAAKVHALTAHSQRLQAHLQQREQETRAQLDALALRKDKVVGDIQKQIGELEALATRELNRYAQETAAQEADLNAAREQVGRDLTEVALVRQRLQGLANQFGPAEAAAPG